MAILIKDVEMPKHDDEYVTFTVYGDGGLVYGPLNRPHVRYKHRAVPVPSQWIPVTKRLPDVFKHVLVNIPGMAPHPTVQEAFREKNGMWYSNGFRYEADEITHWMPLPEPPKEKT